MGTMVVAGSPASGGSPGVGFMVPSATIVGAGTATISASTTSLALTVPAVYLAQLAAGWNAIALTVPSVTVLADALIADGGGADPLISDDTADPLYADGV
jgi:hypothetical protein